MNKKVFAIGLIVLIIAVLGVTAVFAQDIGPVEPPVTGPNFQDANGDGLCDTCGQVPGIMGQYNRGAFGQGMMANGQQAMMGNTSSLTAIAAEMAGMTVQEAVAELAQGLSVADFAANHNLDVQAIMAAFIAAHTTQLETAVANGFMTQEQADEMLAYMTSSVADHINQPWVQGGYGQHGLGNPNCPMNNGETGTGLFGPRGGQGGNGMHGGNGGIRGGGFGGSRG